MSIYSTGNLTLHSQMKNTNIQTLRKQKNSSHNLAYTNVFSKNEI